MSLIQLPPAGLKPLPPQAPVESRPPSINNYPFLVDSTPSKTNSAGQAPARVLSKTSLFVQNVIAPGATLPVPLSGNWFYITQATAPIDIRPSGGIFNTYAAGTGLDLDLSNSFSLLEIRNTSAFAVVFQVFVGFDKFIDKRLFLTSQQNPQAVFPTYPVPNIANVININDLSGQQFTDVNGVGWYAMFRTAIIICNVDAGATFLIYKSGAIAASDPAIAAVYPLTSLRLDVQGNYRISTFGGGNINLIVSEIYTSLLKV